MNLPEWPWQKIAIVAAAATVVISVGFLSGKTGPVQGSAGHLLLLRTDNECMVSVSIHLGSVKSRQLDWFYYANKNDCLIERKISDSSYIGRESVSESIKAAVGHDQSNNRN